MQQENPRIVLLAMFNENGNIYDGESDSNKTNGVSSSGASNTIEEVMNQTKLLELDLVLVPMQNRSLSICIEEGIKLISSYLMKELEYRIVCYEHQFNERDSSTTLQKSNA